MNYKVLKRPMFRIGGGVDSQGTGITSGMDTPRKNYGVGTTWAEIMGSDVSYADALSAYGKKYESLDIDPESPSDEIVKNFAKYSGIKIENIVVCILDRLRHKELIDKVRSIGARIKLIPDGDVSAVSATSFEDSGVDIYMGIGGSPEGVLAAAALRCIGGKIYTKLIFDNDKQIERAKLMGISDPNRIYLTNDLASGDVMFSATGVTDGTLLKGVLIKNDVATTQSVVMRSKTKTVRYVNASHDLRVKEIVK